jgi:hypothetical protein
MVKRDRPPGRGKHVVALLLAIVVVAVGWSALPSEGGTGAGCAGLPPPTIVAQPGVVTAGTPGDDVIYGTSGDDRIAGLAGNDVLVGLGGNDQLSGGDGNDILCGGDGNDSLSGGNGDDLLSGDAGTDQLAGGNGTDTCTTGGQAGDVAAPPPSCDSVIITTTTTTTTSTTIPTTTSSSTSTTTSSSTSSTSSTTSTSMQPVTTPAIHLGYADTLHDVAFQFVPDPWLGDPGVVFLGCLAGTPECGPSYDGGAIRIDNPASNPPLTLTSAVVVIGPCTFTPWVALVPATAGSGESFILTQTGTLGPPAPPPCDGRVAPVDRPFLNFDTSEGPFDTIDPPFSNCDPTLVPFPVITLNFSNGMSLVVTDTDEILNTGGTDRFACTGQEEATPWTAVAPANIVRMG